MTPLQCYSGASTPELRRNLPQIAAIRLDRRPTVSAPLLDCHRVIDIDRRTDRDTDTDTDLTTGIDTHASKTSAVRIGLL